MKKQTVNKIKRITIMSGIFIAALLIYFFMSYSSMEHSNEVYSSMDEPGLPIIYVKENEYMLNPMHAYIQEMGNNTERDMLTVLPEDRKLELIVQEYDNMVMSVKYEIRSKDLSHLIENGTVTDIDRSNGNTNIVLPIQNLIKKEKDYILKITLDTGEKSLNYYTRILWTDHDYTKEMEKLALSFTASTFDKNEAKSIASYLETTEIADNTTLGHVNLHNSFNQITWGNTGMVSSEKYYMTLKEFDGVMGEIQISYESKMTDENGEEKKFLNEDNYVLRYDPSRIYIMNFDRRTHEIYEGSKGSYVNKKLILGVGNEEDIKISKSENGQYIAFKSNQELWLFDQEKEAKVKNIFSYRSKYDDVRANYSQHDAKILGIDDKGNVDFLIYGYINRGRHEGKCGIVYYTYDNANDTLVENFFIAMPENFEKIKEDMEKLSYLSMERMLYIYYDGNVYGIDTSSYEVITIVSGLEESEFISSNTHRYVAYQDPESEDMYHSKKITLLDLETNKAIDITKSSSYKRVLGFNQDDLIYGIIDPEMTEKYTMEHDIPISEIHILGPDSEEKTNYSKDGQLFTNVSVNGLRIQFDKVSLSSEGGYIAEGSETIISNKKDESAVAGLSTINNSTFGKVWYIDVKEQGNKVLKSYAPRKFSVERASTIDLNPAEKEKTTPLFYAYSLGHYRGCTLSLRQAYELVYDDYGYVTNENGEILWNRADKNTIVKLQKYNEKIVDIIPLLDGLGTIREDQNYIILNASGMDMNSALYYLNKGYPLIAYLNNKINLIIAYDQFNITMFNPENQLETVVGREEAEELFKSNNYHFVAVIPH